MKIAIFSDTFLPEINGVTTSIANLVRVLGREHEIIILVPAYKPKNYREDKGNLTIYRFRSFGFPMYKGMHVAAPDIRDVLEIVRGFQPDVIHIHTPGSLGILGILAAKLEKIRLAGTYHTLFSEMLMYISPRKLLEKHLAWIDNLIGGNEEPGVSFQAKNLPEEKESIPQKITWSAVNRLYKACDVIICPSRTIKKELVARNIDRPIVVLSNGIDLNLFPVKKKYNSEPILMHAGRLSFEKNVDSVIRVFRTVKEMVPGAKLVIAGDGPAMNKLRDLTYETGLTGSVKFLGMVPREKLANQYRQAAVFVTASTMETQGLVILEAMASGLPVVAVRKYATADLVRPGINGYLVRPGNEKDMAAKVAKIITDTKFQEEMGSASRKISEGHDLRKVAGEMEGVYRGLIDGYFQKTHQDSSDRAISIG